MQTSNLREFFGITVTNIWDENLEEKLKKLGTDKDKTIVRIVIDKVDDYSTYIDAFKMVGKYSKCLLQVADSYLDSELTDKEYNEREAWMLKNLARYSPFVEISNEIGPSSDWLSGHELQRARNSSKLWKGHERIVTYFWNYNPKQMKAYIKDNPIECEHKMISFYPRSAEDFRDVELFLKTEKLSGLSEFGFQQWGGHKLTKRYRKQYTDWAYDIGSPVMLWDWQETAKY